LTLWKNYDNYKEPQRAKKESKMELIEKKTKKRLAKLEAKKTKIEKKIGKIKYKQRKKIMDAQRGSLVL
jgi:hypothetical protein